MKSIHIITVFGDKPAHVEISAPLGVGGATYYVEINGAYNGRLWKTNKGWEHDLHPTTILQGDDVAVIIELIERNV